MPVGGGGTGGEENEGKKMAASRSFVPREVPQHSPKSVYTQIFPVVQVVVFIFPVLGLLSL